EIGFADHAPAKKGFDPEHRMTLDQFSEYVREIQKLRTQFPSIIIRLGIEVDLHPDFEDVLNRLRQNYPIEYVIGSVHFVEDFFVFSTEETHRSNRPEETLVHQYFQLIDQGIESGLVDVIGHIDVIKWALPHAKMKIFSEGQRILEHIAERGLIIELNTSGLRKHPGEMYPAEDFLRLAHTWGIPICLGSDAHRPQEIGADFDKAYDLLKRIGYCREAILKNGLRGFVPVEKNNQ
ncbi:histidinol-phosphatase, partial [bacterium]